MRSPIYKPGRRYGFNMTPMIDVVFLLIIFFLVSSHLARQETQMELDLPIAESGKEDTDQTTPRLTINVKPDGTMWLAGRTVTREQLVERLRDARSNKGDDLQVRVRGSRSTAYANVEPIMLACTRAGVWNVDYAVYVEDRQ